MLNNKAHIGLLYEENNNFLLIFTFSCLNLETYIRLLRLYPH